MAVYGARVAGELALISLGSRTLTVAGEGNLRPALIAAVVGLHFVPFAWALSERIFSWFVGPVSVLGALGLLLGATGVAEAAEASAVLAGLVMLTTITLYAQGRFALACPPDTRKRNNSGVPIPLRDSARGRTGQFWSASSRS